MPEPKDARHLRRTKKAMQNKQCIVVSLAGCEGIVTCLGR